MSNDIYTRDELRELYVKHNHYLPDGRKKKSSEYKSWHNTKVKHGDLFCEEWLKFINFIVDMGDKPNSKLTIRRKDESKCFCKDNCYWGEAVRTPRQPKPKKEKPIIPKKMVGNQITYNGLTMNMSQWERHLGFKEGMISNRINKLGWSPEEAVSTAGDKKSVVFDGVEYLLIDLSRDYGIPYSTIDNRVNAGLSFDQVVSKDYLTNKEANIVYIAKVFVDDAEFIKVGITNETKQRLSKHKQNLRKINGSIRKLTEYHLSSEREARDIERMVRESLDNVSLGVDGFITENYVWSGFHSVRLAAVMEMMIAESLVY